MSHHQQNQFLPSTKVNVSSDISKSGKAKE